MEQEQGIIFFLHNRFLEIHDLEDEHPTYGKCEYLEIIAAFEKADLKVITEQRGDTNVPAYAAKVVDQIDRLILKGTEPRKITVIGTSKGGYIAQYVSSLANNPNLNFVFVACYQDTDIQNYPEINYCGNILTIHETSDPFGVSAIERKNTSSCEIRNFKEVELSTGMKHGFLYKPLPEWIKPSIQWAKGNYK